MSKIIKIGLAGLGTVGGGVWDVVNRNCEDLHRRSGHPVQIKTVCVRNLEKAKARLGDADVLLTQDWHDIINDPEIEIVIEVMGGTTVARELILAAIAAGKHVITANKALLALHGNEIFGAANASGTMVAYEAAVAGGIPIIKALREGLAANRIEWVAGIINGTCNYILTNMREKGISFQSALASAQELGYAEADPTFDIEGIDAGHKATLLASAAFGVPVNFSAATIEGISSLDARDIAYAEELGYRIKLLGITKRTERGIELRVHPTLVPKTSLIASVEGVMNAVIVKGDAVGCTLYYGRGAGSLPTASAVVADLVDVCRLLYADEIHQVPELSYQSKMLGDTPFLSMSETVSSYYLRIGLADRPGALAEVARILGSNSISIEQLLQREAPHGGNAEVIVLTHSAREGDVRNAIAAIETLESVSGSVTLLRKESLG